MASCCAATVPIKDTCNVGRVRYSVVVSYQPMSLAELARFVTAEPGFDTRWRLVVEFLKEYHQEPEGTRQRLLTDVPESTGDERWDALFAGLAEHLAMRDGRAAPGWLASLGDRLARRGVVADLYVFGGAAMAPCATSSPKRNHQRGSGFSSRTSSPIRTDDRVHHRTGAEPKRTCVVSPVIVVSPDAAMGGSSAGCFRRCIGRCPAGCRYGWNMPGRPGTDRSPSGRTRRWTCGSRSRCELRCSSTR